MTLVAPRIVSDTSQVRRINHEIHFAWQVQYLAKLECDCSLKAKHFRAILGDSWCTTCFLFSYKMRLQDGTSQVSEAAGARRRFHGRIILGLSSNRLYIGGSN